MSNGDCPVGAKNGAHIEELERRMTQLESTVQRTCEVVADHVTTERTRRQSLDGWSKAAVIIGPALASFATWLVTHWDAVSTAAPHAAK